MSAHHFAGSSVSGRRSAGEQAFLAAAAPILLLTCANIVSHLHARGEWRTHELAVRMALDGSAVRVARIPLLEEIVLCLPGWLLGARSSNPGDKYTTPSRNYIVLRIAEGRSQIP
jgi:hypothetical protein